MNIRDRFVPEFWQKIGNWRPQTSQYLRHNTEQWSDLHKI